MATFNFFAAFSIGNNSSSLSSAFLFLFNVFFFLGKVSSIPDSLELSTSSNVPAYKNKNYCIFSNGKFT